MVRPKPALSSPPPPKGKETKKDKQDLTRQTPGPDSKEHGHRLPTSVCVFPRRIQIEGPDPTITGS